MVFRVLGHHLCFLITVYLRAWTYSVHHLFSLPQDFIAVLGVPTEQLVYTPAIFGSSALNMLKALRNAVPFCCLELHFTNGIHFDICTDFQQYLARRTEIQRRNTSSIYRMHKPSKCFRPGYHPFDVSAYLSVSSSS